MSGSKINLEHMMAKVYEIFSRYDKDESETLEVTELMDLLLGCKINITQTECEVIIQGMDSNQDGVMDFCEFMTFLGMIFKIRFSKKNMLREEFEKKLKAKKSTLRRLSSKKKEKPTPPRREGSVIQTTPTTKL